MKVCIDNKEVLIDDEDFDTFNKYRWYIQKDKGDLRYVRCKGKINGVQAMRLHRLLLEAPFGTVVDHINHNGLDNRRSNLRLLQNNRQNLLNRRISVNNKSGKRGVRWMPRQRKWRAEITVNYKTVYLGQSVSKDDCSRMYEEARKLYYA